MKWFKWTWPIVGLALVGADYAFGLRLLAHPGVRWPRQLPWIPIVWDITVIGMSVTFSVGAVVAIILYIRQNKPPTT